MPFVSICKDSATCLLDEIDGQRREMYDIERTIRNMQNDVVKLNTLLHKQRNLETVLEQTNILTENDFIAGLKVCDCQSQSVSRECD